MKCYVGPGGKKDFLTSPSGVPVIVDVLRACSTIVAAMSRGAAEVIPVEELDDAMARGRGLGATLIGERGGRRVEGFEHGNSPTEMLRLPLEGRTIVISTSNGTRIMVAGGIIASTLNAGAVAARIAGVPHAYLLASGAPARSGEDLCAAQLIEQIAGLIGHGTTVATAVSEAIASPDGRRLLDCIRNSESGKKLSAYGFSDDVEMICTQINQFPIVPLYNNGIIKPG